MIFLKCILFENNILTIFRYCVYENLVPCGGASVLCHCYLPTAPPCGEGSLDRDEDPGAAKEGKGDNCSHEGGLSV